MASPVGELIFDYNHKLVESWPVPSGTQADSAVLDPSSGRVGVTITARGDSTRTTALVGTITSITEANGGIGNLAGEAVVAMDGIWKFAVTGVSGTTTLGTKVYLTADGTALTTTATSNVYAGVVVSRLGSATASAALVKFGA